MKWNILEPAPSDYLEQFPELHPTVATLLFQRGLTTQDEIDEFLTPDYSKHIYDPFLFQDMEKAVARLNTAIEQQEKITIHGDYDADGVSASVILTDTLQALGHDNIDVFLPHRDKDGYGLNLNTVQYLHDNGTNVIITCDCGISNTKEVQKAQELGMDVIITDHHSIPAEIPPAHAIIHPKIETETYPCKDLAGGGVAFKLAQGLLKTHAKGHDLLANGETHEAFEKWLLDMVAVASVADMVPLLGESRTLTKFGLLVLNKTRRLGMRKLFLEAKIEENDGSRNKVLDAFSIGFQIAPRINAAGRLDHANVAYKLMVADKATDAIDLAWQLEQNNKERREVTDEFIEQAMQQIEADQKNSPVLFVKGDDWTTGLVGLIASKLKETYYKPVIAMAYNNNQLTGSGRSISGFDLIAALQSMPQFFSKFGGHPMACGFSLNDYNDLQAFKDALIAYYNEDTKNKDLSPTLDISFDMPLKDASWDLLDHLEQFKPFGQKNLRPKFVSRDVTVFDIKAMGKDSKHLRMTIKTADGAIKKCVGWRLGYGNDPNFVAQLKKGDTIDIVYEIDINEWNGNREIQLVVQDIEKK